MSHPFFSLPLDTALIMTMNVAFFQRWASRDNSVMSFSFHFAVINTTAPISGSGTHARIYAKHDR